MLFMPYLIGGLILGYIWSFVLGDGMSTLAELTGNSSIFFNWLVNKKFAFMAMIVVATWQMAGYMMIIYIAGLQAIPGELSEAAAIDGASSWQTLTRVKLPMLMPSITICTFLTITNGFKLFDQNLALTNGAPSRQSELLALNIYNTFYGRTGFEGVGQAKAVIFLIIVAAISLLQNRFARSKEA